MSLKSRINNLALARYNYAGLSEERTLILRRNFKRRSILRAIFLIVALLLVTLVDGKYALPLAILVVVSSDAVAYVIENSRNETVRQLMQAQKEDDKGKVSGQASAS